MEEISFSARLRTETGKGPAKKLRQKNLMPGVFYGPETDALSLILDSSLLKKIITAKSGKNVLIDLSIIDEKKSIKKTVMLKELQVNPVTRDYLHADFCEVAMGKNINIPVRIELKGKSQGVAAGGILHQAERELEVRCLPSQIPELIEVDVTDLNIGDSIHVKDITGTEEVEILTDPGLVVVNILAPKVEEEAVSVEEPEEEEATKEEEKDKEETEKRGEEKKE